MDKKMRKVSAELRKGESLIKDAERKNNKLADYDQKVRDPIIDRAKRAGITAKKSKHR
jgi:hypothetical protein